RVYAPTGREITPPSVSWSENDLAQAIGPSAWYVLDDEGLGHEERGRSVAEMIEAARAAGGTVVDPAELPFRTAPGARVAVHVAAGVTHTIGGLRVDPRAPRFRGTAGFRCASRVLDQARPQRIGFSRRAARSGVTRPIAAARSQSRFVAIFDNRVPSPPDGTARRSGSPSRARPGPRR